MKALLFAEWFYPESVVAAVRPTKLYKYWKRAGHEVNVIAMDNYFIKPEHSAIEIDEKDVLRVDAKTWLDKHYVKYKTQEQQRTAAHQTSRKNENAIKRFIKNRIIRHYFVGKQKSWEKNCKKLIKSMNFDYDIVFTTFGPTTTLKLGKFIKQRHPHVKWIADFRDQPFRVWHTQVPIFLSERWVKRLCGKADILTCVSEGVVSGTRISQKMRHKTHVISNGFDKDDIESIKCSSQSDKFNILYTGTFCKQDDLQSLFKAIAELISEGKIDKDKISVEYAGRQFASLDEHAKKYGMQAILKNHGFVSRNDSLKLQSECSLLLVARWNSTGQEGMLSGKVFEYLMQGKPILAIVSGNLKNSNLRELLFETNSGFTYEEANDEEDFGLLKDYILMQYKHFINSELLEYKPNIDNIEKYNWKNLAQKFSDAIGLVSEKKRGNI